MVSFLAKDETRESKICSLHCYNAILYMWFSKLLAGTLISYVHILSLLMFADAISISPYIFIIRKNLIYVFN